MEKTEGLTPLFFIRLQHRCWNPLQQLFLINFRHRCWSPLQQHITNESVVVGEDTNRGEGSEAAPSTISISSSVKP